MKRTDPIRRASVGKATGNMLRILQILSAAKANGLPFMFLLNVSPRTINALMRRDWISPSFDKQDVLWRYGITPRGEKALKAFNTKSKRRNDKLCPTCGIRPRKVTKSGKLASYCAYCRSDKWHAANPPKAPDTMCSACGKAKKHPKRSQCLECYRKAQKEYSRRYRNGKS